MDFRTLLLPLPNLETLIVIPSCPVLQALVDLSIGPLRHIPMQNALVLILAPLPLLTLETQVTVGLSRTRLNLSGVAYLQLLTSRAVSPRPMHSPDAARVDGELLSRAILTLRSLHPGESEFFAILTQLVCRQCRAILALPVVLKTRKPTSPTVPFLPATQKVVSNVASVPCVPATAQTVVRCRLDRSVCETL